jgi:PelA/Pel-15E family pectate lyase
MSADPAQPPSARDRALGVVAELGVPLAYFVGTLGFSRHLRRFEANPDEGINLAKAALRGRGHTLYDDVWSDQPPLFTEMLRGLFAVVGEDVVAGRVLVLACACALLWACARIARLAWGAREALVATCLLVVVPPIPSLSISVMIGLPALAFGTLAVAAAAHAHAGGHPAWRAASGALLAAGVLTKLSAGLLAPVLLAGVVFGTRRGARRRPALVFTGAFLGTAALGFFLLAGPQAVAQLVTSHVVARRDAVFRAQDQYGLVEVGADLVWLGALGFVGIVVALRHPGVIPRVIVGWAAVAIVALAVHRPLWRHHLPLATVPAALLAAPVVVTAVGAIRRRTAPWFEGRRAPRVALVLLAVLSVTSLAIDAGRWRLPRPEPAGVRGDDAIVAALRTLARPGDTILTDRPIFAFRAGVPVVPETAVFSGKRLHTGLLDEARLIEVVAGERPALVLLGRFSLPRLRAEVRARYRAVLERRGQTLFRRADADESTPSCAWPAYLDEPAGWYGSLEARTIAEHVLRAQHPGGGWAKNEDRHHAWTHDGGDPGDAAAHAEDCATIDNGATTTELRFLARVLGATGDARYEAAFLRGLDHLLAAQTPRGGWPQVPGFRAGSYPAAITLNDDAMAHVMELVDAVGNDPAYGFVDAARRTAARDAFDRGVQCLVRAQVRVAGVSSVWCAQHDPVTLAPVAARSYEPASLSGLESVGVVRVLMRVVRPAPDVVAAVEAAVRWFERSRIESAPPRWARFYDLVTGVPIFPDRDGTRAPSESAVSVERRMGYVYVTDAPQRLLETDVPRWRARLADGR